VETHPGTLDDYWHISKAAYEWATYYKKRVRVNRYHEPGDLYSVRVTLTDLTRIKRLKE
jgi:hypothetical protein